MKEQIYTIMDVRSGQIHGIVCAPDPVTACHLIYQSEPGRKYREVSRLTGCAGVDVRLGGDIEDTRGGDSEDLLEEFRELPRAALVEW